MEWHTLRRHGNLCKKWIKIIQDKEKPDVIIGLFHSGAKGGIITPEYKEDASLDVAINVPGFDLIMFGHDHTRSNQFVTNIEGKKYYALTQQIMPRALLMSNWSLPWIKNKWQKTVDKKRSFD